MNVDAVHSATSPYEAAPEVDRAYLDQVMIEIEEEVRKRRASGDLPARLERELDELFLEHSPVAGRGGSLGDALRMVDNAAYIDPVVPIESKKSGGAAIKKGLRKLNLWYIGFVAYQVSQFASATSRALHLVDDRLADLVTRLDAQETLASRVVDPPPGAGSDPWWSIEAIAAFGSVSGRVLHGGCGNGLLVRQMTEKGIDAYGVDPRPGRTDIAEAKGVDLREEDVVEHLRAVGSSGLGGVALSGVTDGLTSSQRVRLLEVVADRLAPEGTLVVHSWAPDAWRSDNAPAEADLAPGSPWRSGTWDSVLAPHGFATRVVRGPSGADYLVVAVRAGGSPER